jgi:hypothetical protein
LTQFASFVSKRKFEDFVEGKFSTQKEIAAGMPQGSILAPTLYSLYKNDRPAAPGTHLMFADERHSLCKLQPGLSAVNL